MIIQATTYKTTQYLFVFSVGFDFFFYYHSTLHIKVFHIFSTEYGNFVYI